MKKLLLPLMVMATMFAFTSPETKTAPLFYNTFVVSVVNIRVLTV